MLRPSCLSRLLLPTLRRQVLALHVHSSFRCNETLLFRAKGRRRFSEIPSFREQIARTGQVESFSARVQKPGIIRQVSFALAASAVIYYWYSQRTNIETAVWIKRLKESSSAFQNKEPTTDDIKRARYFHLGKQLQAMLATLKENTSNLPGTIKSVPIFATAKSLQNVLDASEARRVCWNLAALNFAIFLAWKIRRWQPFMSRAFVHDPLSGRSYTMITSAFSHKSFWHLLLNTMALTSFTATAAQYLIREQRKSGSQEATVTCHLQAFFITSGLFAGLFSHIAWTRIVYPRILSRIASPSSRPAGLLRRAVTEHTTVPSTLGASGAIYASFVVTALAFPEAEVALFFPPGITLPIQWGLCGTLLLDTIGIIRGWRLFNHWGHIGGALFGVVYYVCGPTIWQLARALAPLFDIFGVNEGIVNERAKILKKQEEAWEQAIAAANSKKPRSV